MRKKPENPNDCREEMQNQLSDKTEMNKGRRNKGHETPINTSARRRQTAAAAHTAHVNGSRSFLRVGSVAPLDLGFFIGLHSAQLPLPGCCFVGLVECFKR